MNNKLDIIAELARLNKELCDDTAPSSPSSLEGSIHSGRIILTCHHPSSEMVKVLNDACDEIARISADKYEQHYMNKKTRIKELEEQLKELL